MTSPFLSCSFLELSSWMAPRGVCRAAAASTQAAKCEISSQICPDIPREITAGSILFSVQHRPETVLIIKSGAVEETINMTGGRELRESQCLLCLSKVCLDLKISCFSSLIYASEEEKGMSHTNRKNPTQSYRKINLFLVKSWKDELDVGQLKILQLLLPSAGDATGVW